MKILLDECLPVDFRHSFGGHDAHSVAGYQVLLTVDQGMPHQQNMVGRKIPIVAIRSGTNQLEHLLPLAGRIEAALASLQPGQFVTVG